MEILLTIVVAFVYSIIAWRAGFSLRRNILLWRELQKPKRALKPGYQLGKSWYVLRRKVWLSLIIFGALSLFLPLGVIAGSYHFDFRFEHIFGHGFLAVFPVWLGWEGIIPIPIPGINIEK
jgi:hypothetical protein